MKIDTVKNECQSLRTIRERWQVRFNPFERLDGVNETIECLHALRDSPVCWSTIAPELAGGRVEKLIDDLEDLYALALQPWDEFKSIFKHQETQREFLRRPDGVIPARIQREARNRFWELVTTSRFSVNAEPSMFELQRVNWTTSTITIRHAVSLAAMVCIKESIEALESVELWWRDDSKPYRAGKPFDWLAQHDPDQVELILATVYETHAEREGYTQKVKGAWDARNQAELWLSHLNTLNFDKTEIDFSRRVAKSEKSKQAKSAAQKPRKAAALTPELVAGYFKAHPAEKWETNCNDLAETYGVSSSTVARRYEVAKKTNLVS